MISFCCSFLALIGRVCISLIFLSAVFDKVFNWNATLEYIAEKNVSHAQWLLIGATVLELLGGLSLFLGYKTRFGALMLIVLLVPVTMVMHNFWELADPERKLQTTIFFKNLAILGGLLYVLSYGGGGLSMDGCCNRESPVKKEI